MNNCRPISILPVFSKVAERVIYKCLSDFCNKYNSITNNQYGFQKGKSTEMALLNIKNKIIDNIENQCYTLGVFLDFRKAFDSIKHDILLRKLPLYGIRGSALNLISSYMTSRFQYTVLNDMRSPLAKLRYGVPQESILGPLLFLLYINDIVNIPQTPNIILYADDTNVFFTGSCLDSIERETNNWLEQLHLWLGSNRLELNTAKTKYIIFRAKNKPITSEISTFFSKPEY